MWILRRVPIIEGKLYAWGLAAAGYAWACCKQSRLMKPSIDPKNKRDSLQEIWVLKNQYEIWKLRLSTRLFHV